MYESLDIQLCALAAHVCAWLRKPGKICSKIYFYPNGVVSTPIPSPGESSQWFTELRQSDLNLELPCSVQVCFAPSAEKHCQIWSVPRGSGSEAGQFWFLLTLRTPSSGIQMKRTLLKECRSDFSHFDADWWAQQVFACYPAPFAFFCLCTVVCTTPEETRR